MYAYVSTLYGNNEYWIGALVLGWSLAKTNPKYPCILMISEDVSTKRRELLSKVWTLMPVQTIKAHPSWIQGYQQSRWKEVFTKIAALKMTQYTKILLLDTDMLVLRNMDHLFASLPAPSALCIEYRHGAKMRPGTIVNAGALLMEPNLIEYNSILGEITKPSSPGKGNHRYPEQEYLSKRWSGRWTCLGPEYNYQYFLQGDKLPLTKISNIHYSWEVKPWHFLDGKNRPGAEQRLKRTRGHQHYHKYFRKWIDNLHEVRRKYGIKF